MCVHFDQFMEPFRIVASHVAVNVDPTMRFQVAPLMREFFQSFVLLRDRLQLNHDQITVLFEITFFVQHIGYTAAHSRREISAR